MLPDAAPRLTFLLSNDDGIAAPGLAALCAAASRVGESVVVAPLGAHSGCSHRVTAGQPIRVERRAADSFAIDGTPADCVRLGLHEIAANVDWVLAGVNSGGNLGADVFYSGTVAAVREAALHGRKGIAFSHYIKRGMEVDWPRVSSWTARVLEVLLRERLQPGQFWNVNFPHLPPECAEPAIVFCPLDTGPLPLHFRSEGEHRHYAGDYHSRLRLAGSDVDVCFSGEIAVTKLALL